SPDAIGATTCEPTRPIPDSMGDDLRVAEQKGALSPLCPNRPLQRIASSAPREMKSCPHGFERVLPPVLPFPCAAIRRSSRMRVGTARARHCLHHPRSV